MSFLDKFVNHFDQHQQQQEEKKSSRKEQLTKTSSNLITEDQEIDQLQSLMFSSTSIATKENQQPTNQKQSQGIKFKSIKGSTTSISTSTKIPKSTVPFSQQLIKKKSLVSTKNTTFFHDYAYDPNEFPPQLSGKFKNPLSLYRSSRVTIEQSKEIKNLLFNNEKGSFSKAWRQGFYFNKTNSNKFEQSKIQKALPFLQQREDDGPSGILAVVQAHLLKHLLFVSKFDCMSLDDGIQEDKYTIALMAALTDILVKVSKPQASKQQDDILTLESNDSEEMKKNSNKKQIYGFYLAFPDMAPQTNPIQPIQCLLYKVPRHSWYELFQLLCSLRKHYMQPSGHGILLFLYSIIYTHKISTTRRQMMSETGKLIDENGLASEQLINLLNLGKAVSFMNQSADKKKVDSASFASCSKRSNIGYLTSREEILGKFKVSDYLKTPVLSIWVIQIQKGEYGVLFIDDLNSMNKRFSKILMLFYEGKAKFTSDEDNKNVVDIQIVDGKIDDNKKQLSDRMRYLQSIIKTRWGASAKIECLNQFM